MGRKRHIKHPDTLPIVPLTGTAALNRGLRLTHESERIQSSGQVKVVNFGVD